MDKLIKSFILGSRNLRSSTPAVTWEAPLGPDALRPPPVSAHAFVKFDRHRAVYFGGRRTSGYTNDVYLFDLDVRVSMQRVVEIYAALSSLIAISI